MVIDDDSEDQRQARANARHEVRNILGRCASNDERQLASSTAAGDGRDGRGDACTGIVRTASGIVARVGWHVDGRDELYSDERQLGANVVMRDLQAASQGTGWHVVRTHRVGAIRAIFEPTKRCFSITYTDDKTSYRWSIDNKDINLEYNPDRYRFEGQGDSGTSKPAIVVIAEELVAAVVDKAS